MNPSDYKAIAAWGKMMHSSSHYIERTQLGAALSDAPELAVYRDEGAKWMTLNEVTNTATRLWFAQHHPELAAQAGWTSIVDGDDSDPAPGAPIQDSVVRLMNKLGAGIDRVFNEGEEPRRHGFMLLVFPFGKDERGAYISNAERADAIRALRAQLAYLEGDQGAEHRLHSALRVLWAAYAFLERGEDSAYETRDLLLRGIEMVQELDNPAQAGDAGIRLKRGVEGRHCFLQVTDGKGEQVKLWVARKHYESLRALIEDEEQSQ